MGLIMKLWNGGLGQEAMNSERIEKIEAEKRKNEQELKEWDCFWHNLTQEQQDLLRKCDELRGEQWCKEIDEAYVAGFKTGAGLMLEILQEGR